MINQGPEEPGATPIHQTGVDGGRTENDKIDLFEIWEIFWSGRWLIAAFGIGCGAVAIVIALLLNPIYEARVVLMPAERQGGATSALGALAGQFGGLASLAGVNIGGGASEKARALATLKSFVFTAEFIEENNILPILYADDPGLRAMSWNSKSQGKPPSMQEAVNYFFGLRSINLDALSGTITLTIAWKRPDQAALWANSMVDKLNETLRAKEIAEAKRSVEYLQVQVEKTTNIEMQQTLYRLIEAQTKTIMLAKARDEYAFRVIDPAFPPELRSRPKRKLIVFIGCIIGGVVGAFVVLGRRIIEIYKSQKPGYPSGGSIR